VQAALDGGLTAVQLREKDLSGRALHALASQLREATARAGASLFVNERVDVAASVGADGVHLGGGALPVDVARTLLPRGALVGQSVHATDEAASSAADFVFFGPVFDTPAKRAFGAPQGIGRLRDAVRAAHAPVMAIGGVDAGNVAQVRSAGAAGVAVIRAILGASDPADATRALLDALGRVAR
jgi:thiamine-phosphate pyrophosphorylase